MSQNEYTTAELAIIREHYPVIGSKGCAKLMQGRSPKAISVKASCLGLKCPKRGGKRIWTTVEVGVLRDRYPKGGMKAVRPYLPFRSDEAISSKVVELGLSAPKTTPEFRKKMAQAAEARRAAKESADVDSWPVVQKWAHFGEWKAEPVNAPRFIFEMQS